MIRKIAKNLTPPFVKEIIMHFTRKVKWHGDYDTWQKAEADSKGYEADNIIEKVYSASLKVKNGEALFERDSVLFNEPDHNWPLLTSVFYVANHLSTLHVTDFGGALGSVFFQYKKLFGSINDLQWAVVEQENYVKIGKEHFAEKDLKFFYSIEECLGHQNPDLLFLSSVLHYLPDPESFIAGLEQYQYKYIFIDRTGFTTRPAHRLTVQKVSSEIYNASYPSWFFNQKKFLNLLQNWYDIILDFPGNDLTNLKGTYYHGFLLKRRDTDRNAF